MYDVSGVKGVLVCSGSLSSKRKEKGHRSVSLWV